MLMQETHALFLVLFEKAINRNVIFVFEYQLLSADPDVFSHICFISNRTIFLEGRSIAFRH